MFKERNDLGLKPTCLLYFPQSLLIPQTKRPFFSSSPGPIFFKKNKKVAHIPCHSLCQEVFHSLEQEKKKKKPRCLFILPGVTCVSCKVRSCFVSPSPSDFKLLEGKDFHPYLRVPTAPTKSLNHSEVLRAE